MCGGGGSSKKKKPATPAAPPVPQIVQDMVRAVDLGPTGYTQAMRDNLGMDIQTGGVRPTSGMAGQDPLGFSGYQPVAAKPDPLMEILAAAPMPPPPPVPAPGATPAPTPTTPRPSVPTGGGYSRPGAGNQRGDRQR